jgi:two-component system nitrate/nitrite response regulator NarL
MFVDAPNRVQNRKKPIRVIILDASRMGAQLLADALKGEQFEVVYGGSRVTDSVAASDHADVVLLTAATDKQCLQACALAPSFRAASKGIRIILLAEDPNRETVIEAFKAEIRGIFSRTTSIGDLRKCILAVAGGQVWASNRDVNYLLDALSEPPSMRLVDARGAELLSKREAEVVRCVSEGLTNREIADQLGLSENTVKNYLFRIFDKLGVSTRVELIMYAIGNRAQQANRGSSGTEVEPSGSLEATAEQLITALSSLEEIQRNSRGSPRDPASAYMWLLVAQVLSAQVQVNSRDAANALQRELTPRQRVKAERAAERWLRERLEGPEPAAQAAPSRSVA